MKEMRKEMKGRWILPVVALILGVCCAPTASELDKKPGDSGSNPGSGSETITDKELKNWMVDYMREAYLWNEAMESVTPDYTLGYEELLEQMLVDIAAQDDINHDDGHWTDGKRQYFYSNIVRYESGEEEASRTRGVREMTEGSGIEYVYYTLVSAAKRPCAFIVGAVSPYSPAGKAGLKRGEIIAEVNGEPIQESEMENAFEKVIYPSGSVTVTVYDSRFENPRQIVYGSESYEDNPVWKCCSVTAANNVKVGYLCYNSFNMYYDDKLLEAFATLQGEGVEDLILDLRYNGGGHVVSSLLMGTFVAGQPHKGEIYSRMVPNAQRQAAGDRGSVFRIGNMNYGDGTYSEVLKALDFSLGLERVYVLCSESTASASELVINGLRGIGLDVRIVGTTTNGKNVGMESISKVFDGYEYVFSPITFYSENASGFRDYGDGFAPDVEAAESTLPIEEWGDPDDGLLSVALQWIETGSKPAPKSRSAAVSERRALLPAHRANPGGMILPAAGSCE